MNASRGKLLHPNTIEVQFNILRTLVHRAIEVGIMEASKDPFLVFKYKGVKTTKEKLDDDEMERIINLELEEGSLIWHCKNYFLFSYYCAGIRAADLIQLRWGNVTGSGRLHYQMGKNHKERDLLLVEQAVEILKHYHREDAKPTDYIFPLLSNEAEYASYIRKLTKTGCARNCAIRCIRTFLQRIHLSTKYLKKIAEQAEIEKPLSMHISRHSFAHIAQEAGAESSAIKNILGHSNLATTERYMGSFDTSKTDETLRNVFNKKPSRQNKVEEPTATKEEQAIELLKGMTPAQIMAIILQSTSKVNSSVATDDLSTLNAKLLNSQIMNNFAFLIIQICL